MATECDDGNKFMGVGSCGRERQVHGERGGWGAELVGRTLHRDICFSRNGNGSSMKTDREPEAKRF